MITTRQNTTTSNTTNFVFSGLQNNVSYTVNVAPGLNEGSTPPFISTSAPSGALIFALRGTPSIVTVTGAPAGTIVLLTTSTYTGRGSTWPPNQGVGAPSQTNYQIAADANGNARLSVTPAYNYYLNCWKVMNGHFIRYSNGN